MTQKNDSELLSSIAPLVFEMSDSGRMALALSLISRSSKALPAEFITVMKDSIITGITEPEGFYGGLASTLPLIYTQVSDALNEQSLVKQ
jgi:hypothetical protein